MFSEFPKDIVKTFSPVSILPRYCTLTQVKFHVFRRLKLYRKIVFDFLINTYREDSIKQIKNYVIYTLNDW